MEKISFVLPLKIYGNEFGSDLERVKKILIPSILKYFNLNQIDNFLVITLSSEHDEVEKELSEYKYKMNLSIIPEEIVLKLIPDWEKHRNIHARFRILKEFDRRFNSGKIFEWLRLKYSWFSLSGWYKQQMLKMFSAKMINTRYYMTLDADLCLTHPTDMATLFPEGKAIYTPEVMGINHDWWLGSAKMLDLNFKFGKEKKGIGVTPEILSTRVTLNLIDFLHSKAQEKKFITIFDYLATNNCWTEYTLYWLFLLNNYNKEEYYASENHFQILESGYSVWFKDQALDKVAFLKNIDAAFAENRGLFLIIQSNCMPLSEYYETIKKHII